MSIKEEEVAVEEEFVNGAEVEGEVAEADGVDVVEQEEEVSGAVGTYISRDVNPVTCSSSTKDIVPSQIPTSFGGHDHVAAQEDFTQELEGVAIQVAREVADAFMAERRLFIQESIAEGKLVTTFAEASQAIELGTREQLRAHVGVLTDQLGHELVAHVLEFSWDSDEVVADTARHVLETLYTEQWSAYLPTFHEQRAKRIAEEVAKVSFRRSVHELYAGGCTCSKEFKDVLIVQVKGFGPPPWVQRPERTIFTARYLAPEMSETLRQIGCDVEIDVDLLFVSWQ
eukprot:CAMPEP_0115306606 /NCGR_PEP_ID=MMETSP0270-20121206/72678_1 /TAXON_ID=71861 /ORGANISM="Scrippsiella trochoidea, Strain CCMP3099" /LENGTH=284 /DNA_ID=CAMNT_0002724955 /DNA_START=69 /DNA_END=923 /DNA_ORIENTATION=-